jgi:hypothetical protein
MVGVVSSRVNQFFVVISYIKRQFVISACATAALKGVMTEGHSGDGRR